jgi:uncharacterized membrane protein YjgN (DUF898 family)
VNLPQLSERTRAYFYRLVAAVLPLLVVLGVIEVDDVALYLGIAAALLATANTSTSSDDAGQTSSGVVVVILLLVIVLLATGRL